MIDVRSNTQYMLTLIRGWEFKDLMLWKLLFNDLHEGDRRVKYFRVASTAPFRHVELAPSRELLQLQPIISPYLPLHLPKHPPPTC